MALHKDLSDSELHEAKGTSSASANTVLVADGAGGSSFSKITVDNINDTSIKNLNTQMITLVVANPTTPFNIFVPIEVGKTLKSVDSIIGDTVVGANLSVDVMKNASILSTIVYNVGITPGSQITATINSAFSTTDSLHLRCTPTGVSAAGSITFVLNFAI